MTKYIYIDESGDLGLSKMSSKVLIISALIEDDSRKLDRIIKNARRYKFSKELRKAKEIKFNKSSHELKKYLIMKLNETAQCRGVHCVLYKKNLTSEYLRDHKHKLYNYAAGQLAKAIVLESCNVEVRIDKSKGKQILRDDFNKYFERNHRDGSLIDGINIFHSQSENFSGLQLADLLSGAVYQKFNNQSPLYVNLINQSTFPQYFKELWK